MEETFERQPQDYAHDDNSSNNINDGLIQEAITQKKRTYRLEIRKRKLQNVFDKIRKPALPLLLLPTQPTSIIPGNTCNSKEEHGSSPVNEEDPHFSATDSTQTTIISAGNNTTTSNMEQLYVQNQNLHAQLQTKMKSFASFELIAQRINSMNVALCNFNEESSEVLDQIISEILNEYLNDEVELEEIISHLKQLFLHISLLEVIKHVYVRIDTKNKAIWCLINLTSMEYDPFDVVGKLVSADIIPLLQLFLKDIKYAPLYENIMWLATNIALDDEKYRLMFIQEGFIFFVNNFLKQITQGFKYQNNIPAKEIQAPLLKVILNFSVSLLNVHQKMEDDQFRVIHSIMDLCMKTNIPELFKLCLTGVLNLFQVNNVLSESKFSQLFQMGFFSGFFICCTQCEDDALRISDLYRNLSYLGTKYVMMLVQKDLCMPIYLFMDHPLKQVRLDMAFSLSNFLLNGKEFVAVASQLMLDIKLIVMLKKESWDIQREAVFALASLLESQEIVQKEEFLTNKDVISVLCEFFNQSYEKFDDEVMEKMLNCFTYVLEFGEYATERDRAYSNNPFYIAIECNSTVPTFEYVINNGSPQNANLAQEILDRYSWTRSLVNPSSSSSSSSSAQYPISYQQVS